MRKTISENKLAGVFSADTSTCFSYVSVPLRLHPSSEDTRRRSGALRNCTCRELRHDVSARVTWRHLNEVHETRVLKCVGSEQVEIPQASTGLQRAVAVWIRQPVRENFQLIFLKDMHENGTDRPASVFSWRKERTSNICGYRIGKQQRFTLWS